MHEFLILKLLHILCFVYWLGGDLGTFYASRFIGRSDLSPQARNTAMTIMMGCDQGPRLAMPLILPLGIHLGQIMQVFTIGTTGLVLAWALCLAWTASVLILHFSHHSALAKILGKIDFPLRVAIAAGLGGLAIYGIVSDSLITADWFAYKLLIFAILVAFGLMIRLNLGPLIGAWGALQNKGASPEGDAVIRSSLNRCLPFVWGIWLGLLINAALGLHLIG